MDINLNDWLGTHLVVLWLFMAVLMGALEVVRRDRVYLMLAAACVGAGLVALVAHLWWVQLFAAVLLGVVALLIVRPRLAARAD